MVAPNADENFVSKVIIMTTSHDNLSHKITFHSDRQFSKAFGNAATIEAANYHSYAEYAKRNKQRNFTIRPNSQTYQYAKTNQNMKVNTAL